MNVGEANRVRACLDCGEPGALLWRTTKGENPGRLLRVCAACLRKDDWHRFGLVERQPILGEVPTELIDGRWSFPPAEGSPPSAVITYTDEPSPETGDVSRASCPKADPASEGDDETDIIIAGRQVPFVQVGMIVHPDDCLNCERDGSPLWCSALVCDIHDDDETARFGMMATLLFRNGERREEPCDELRRRWRLARDFDQGRVYTGRWGAIPRGSVWPVAEVNEDA